MAEEKQAQKKEASQDAQATQPVAVEPVEPATAPPQETEEPINADDVSKATRIATGYLEGIYGNLNLLMFRIEDVRKNTDQSKYHVLGSLLTNVGGPRRYYFIKVNVSDGKILKISSGFKNLDSGEIDWRTENLPPDEL